MTAGSAPSGPWRTLRRLLGDQGRRHAPAYALAFVLMALFAGASGLIAYLVQPAIDEIFIAKNGDALFWLTGLLLGAFTVKAVALYFQTVILAQVGNRVVADVQRRIFDQVLAQPLGFFQGQHSTQLIAQLSFISNAARTALDLVVNSLGRDLLTLIALMTVVLIQDPLLALLALVIAPVATYGVVVLVKKARNVVTTQFTAFSQILEYVQETAQGIRVVKAFGAEAGRRRHLDGLVSAFERALNRLARISATANPMMELLGGLSISFVIIYGGWQVIHAGRTPGEFFSFLIAFIAAYEPAKRLARVNVDLRAALVGVEMLYGLIDQAAPERDPEAGPPLRITRGRIEFADVHFAYVPERPVLRGLTLVAEAGATTALVGQSGGGKTTIMHLLQRFYAPLAGTIRIDGQDISEASLASLRAAVAPVAQDVFLFNGTIRDNIATGRPDATPAEIEAAAHAAGAHEFIGALPRAYDTEVGEHGLKLSGGQRQRIAIARALLKDAPILLLDEATAALDSETERDVQAALDRLGAGRTTIVIAHRLQTVVAAQKICVVEDGRVVEEGRHDDLLRRRGRYFHYYNLQFRDQAKEIA